MRAGQRTGGNVDWGGGSGADRTRARRKSNRRPTGPTRQACSEIGQGSSALFSKNVNRAQKFVNTKHVEEIQVYNFCVWTLVWIITVFDKHRSEFHVCKLSRLIQLRFQFC